MGRDALPRSARRAPRNFNPLSPHGERLERHSTRFWCFHFNPLSPHGERLYNRLKGGVPMKFQSTLPAWGETSMDTNSTMAAQVQSTLPAWGESGNQSPVKFKRRFQSTLPAWGETRQALHHQRSHIISIHSPRMGRDGLFVHFCFPPSNFNPLSPHGERHPRPPPRR